MKKSDIKLAATTLDLALESKRADKVLKAVNTLNSKAMSAEVEIEEMVSVINILNEYLEGKKNIFYKWVNEKGSSKPISF